MAKNFNLDEGDLMYRGTFAILGWLVYYIGQWMAQMTVCSLEGENTLLHAMFIFGALVMVVGGIVTFIFALGNLIGFFMSIKNRNFVCLFGNAFLFMVIVAASYKDVIRLLNHL